MKKQVLEEVAHQPKLGEIESKAIETKLKERGLWIHPIDPDGHWYILT
jgi:hypothetical protein